MKTLHALISVLAMAILWSLSAHAASEPLARFTIDKSIYDQLNPSQQNALVVRAQEINQFIEKKVRPQIPDSLLEKTKNLKIKIALTDSAGRDGLFIPHDSHEQVISVQLVQLNSNGIFALVAHEIYHAIHFTVNPDEESWFREGMAQVFEYITTGEFNGRNLAAAVRNPLTPFFGDYDVEASNLAQYGHNQLYFYYLYSHCGKDDLFWKLTEGEKSSDLRGSYLIDFVLNKINNSGKSECANFDESIISFEVAKLHNQIQFTNTNEKNKFFITMTDITPTFPKLKSAEELKKTIASMPLLSSYKISLKDYNFFKGSCENCIIYYATNTFPYEVSENPPKKPTDFDVILVKIRSH